MNKYYIVVFNSLGLRHYVEYICDQYNENDFKYWYYNEYCKLDDDQFAVFNKMKEACDYIDKYL